MDSTPEFHPSDQSTRSFSKKITTYVMKYNILAHAIGFVIAVFLSISVLGVALYMVVYDFQYETENDTAWAQTIIGFILGVWVTDRPKFIKKDRGSSSSMVTTTTTS